MEFMCQNVEKDKIGWIHLKFWNDFYFVVKPLVTIPSHAIFFNALLNVVVLRSRCLAINLITTGAFEADGFLTEGINLRLENGSWAAVLSTFKWSSKLVLGLRRVVEAQAIVLLSNAARNLTVLQIFPFLPLWITGFEFVLLWEWSLFSLPNAPLNRSVNGTWTILGWDTDWISMPRELKTQFLERSVVRDKCFSRLNTVLGIFTFSPDFKRTGMRGSDNLEGRKIFLSKLTAVSSGTAVLSGNMVGLVTLTRGLLLFTSSFEVAVGFSENNMSSDVSIDITSSWSWSLIFLNFVFLLSDLKLMVWVVMVIKYGSIWRSISSSMCCLVVGSILIVWS